MRLTACWETRRQVQPAPVVSDSHMSDQVAAAVPAVEVAMSL